MYHFPQNVWANQNWESRWTGMEKKALAKSMTWNKENHLAWGRMEDRIVTGLGTMGALGKTVIHSCKSWMKRQEPSAFFMGMIGELTGEQSIGMMAPRFTKSWCTFPIPSPASLDSGYWARCGHCWDFGVTHKGFAVDILPKSFLSEAYRQDAMSSSQEERSSSHSDVFSIKGPEQILRCIGVLEATQYFCTRQSLVCFTSEKLVINVFV